jgi:hypothetical protein
MLPQYNFSQVKFKVTETFSYHLSSRRMRLAGNVARMGDVRSAYNILVGKSEGKRPLGKHTAYMRR